MNDSASSARGRKVSRVSRFDGIHPSFVEWGKNGSQEWGIEIITGPKFVTWEGHFDLK